MRNTKVRALAETAVASALCSLLGIISMYVPPLSLPCSFLCGLPLMYVACRHGWIYGILSAVFATLCAGGLTAGFISAAMLMLSYGLPAMVFGICANRDYKFSTSLIAASVLTLAGMLIQLIMINGSGDGIEIMFTQSAESMTSMIYEMVPKELLPADINITAIMAEVVSETVNTIIYYMPAIMIIMSVATAYLIIMLGIFLLSKFKIKQVEYTRFNMIKMPKITVVMIVLAFLAADLFDTDNIYVAALSNIMIVSIAAVGVSGFSYIDYMVSQKIKSGYIRAMIYAGIWLTGFMFVPFIAELSFILGVFDVFSKRRMPKVSGDDKIENKQK